MNRSRRLLCFGKKLSVFSDGHGEIIVFAGDKQISSISESNVSRVDYLYAVYHI